MDDGQVEKENTEPIEPPTEFNLDNILRAIPDNAEVDIEVMDQDGNVTVEKTDAKKELENLNKRYDVYNQILNCMAG